jgi:hypothetical protein
MALIGDVDLGCVRFLRTVGRDVFVGGNVLALVLELSFTEDISPTIVLFKEDVDGLEIEVERCSSS